MTNLEILQAAIDQAESNGFIRLDSYYRNHEGDIVAYEPIIFSHEFAKTLWKDEPHTCDWCGDEICLSDTPGVRLEGWKIQLMKMVIEEDPLRYLEQFLVKEERE